MTAQSANGIVTIMVGTINLPGKETDPVDKRVSAFLDENRDLFSIRNTVTDLRPRGSHRRADVQPRAGPRDGLFRALIEDCPCSAARF